MTQQSQGPNVGAHGLALWTAGKICFLKTRRDSFTAFTKAVALLDTQLQPEGQKKSLPL